MITTKNLWNLSINQQLLSKYESLTGSLNISETTKKRLSAPLRTMVGPNYKPGQSVLLVGQQTNGWGGDPKTVGSSFYSFESYHGKFSSDYILMEGQTDFLLNRYGQVRTQTINSPFWKACVQISGVNRMADLLSAGVAWSDLMACDLDGDSPLRDGAMDSDELDIFLDYSMRAFNGNLGITKPKVAMLFTGPDYDPFLEKCFNLPKDWKKNDLRSLSECSDPNEDLLKFVKVFQHNGTLFVRTYHPGFLVRKKNDGYMKILDILAETFIRMGITK